MKRFFVKLMILVAFFGGAKMVSKGVIDRFRSTESVIAYSGGKSSGIVDSLKQAITPTGKPQVVRVTGAGIVWDQTKEDYYKDWK